MSYQDIGNFEEQYRSIETLDVGNLRSGTISSKEIVIAGGEDGVIRSQNYIPGEDGWKIDGAGNAEFGNAVFRGTIQAGAGSEVDWSYIKNVVIEQAEITELSFDKITAATNTASLVIGSGGTIASSNYSAGSTGFQIAGTGSAEFNDVTVRGAVYGSYFEASSGGVGISIDPSLYGGAAPLIIFDVNATSTDPRITAFASTRSISMRSGNNTGEGSSNFSAAPTSLNMNVDSTTAASWTTSNTSLYVHGSLFMSSSSSVLSMWKAMDFKGNGVADTGPLAGVTNLSMNGSISTPTTISASGLISTTNYLRATGTGSASNCQIQMGASTTGFYNSGGTIAFVSGGTQVGVFGTGYFGPSSDNTRGCGASGARWTSVWANNGTIQTSDLTHKNVLDEPVPGLDFVNKLKPIKFQWKEGWDSEHVHWGLGAQDVQNLIGNEGPLRADDPDNLAMNYAEIVPALVVAVQELSAKLENHVCGSA